MDLETSILINNMYSFNVIKIKTLMEFPNNCLRNN